MIGSSLDQLLDLASPALGGPVAADSAGKLGFGDEAPLRDLLQRRNGFYAFESALQVFAVADPDAKPELLSWNMATGWQAAFEGLASGYLFFAQDLVGAQFCLRDGCVWRFDPETAEAARIARSLEEWAKTLLTDYRELVLWPLAHEWQLRHGPLVPGTRLVPKIPFVLGGDYAIENLYVADSERALRFYGHLATQLHDLPDGSKVRFEPIE